MNIDLISAAYRISHTGEFTSLRTTEPIGTLVRKVAPDGKRQKDTTRSTTFRGMLVPIILHLSESGPVLVIESTRNNTVRMAQAIARVQDPPVHSDLESLTDLAQARLGFEHPLSQVLTKGVAYHHSSLPREIRAAVEESVTRGHLKYLVATTTMTEILSLPPLLLAWSTRVLTALSTCS